MGAVRSYCEAGSVGKLVAVTRQPDRVKPLMEDWYARHPNDTWGPVVEKAWVSEEVSDKTSEQSKNPTR